MSNKQIITSSGIELQNNQPLDVRDRIQTLSEVNTILNPDIGGIFYCLDTGYYYTITSLTDDLSGVKDYELFTSVGAESVTINDEIIKVTDSNVITIPDDSRYIYESKELRNSQRINITKEKEGKTYNNFYTAENDLRDFLGKTLSSDLKNSIKMVCTAFGKTNQDSDRDIISDISGNGNNLVLSGFSYTPNSGYGNPDYPCGLVTDGIDDFIYSDKTLDSIIGNSGKVTVISMITQISDIEGESFSNSINNIRYNSSLMCTRNIVAKGNTGKTGIYGYTCPNLKVSPTVPSSVKLLGDKEDYVSQGGTHQTNDIYSVVGYKNSSNGNLAELSQVAWYWTIIADRVLTENEIYLIIEYYNLDRCITPQVYYNISQQGITNDNHSDFSDKLVDLSGHGYDMQLNNIAWSKNSGIGLYTADFNDYNNIPSRAIVEVYNNKFTVTESIKLGHFLEINTRLKSCPAYRVRITGLDTLKQGTLNYKYEETKSLYFSKDGEYDIPALVSTEVNQYCGWNFSYIEGEVNVTVEQIAQIENALCLNGIDDFGKTTGLPVLKDYTVVADREIENARGGIATKNTPGAFIFETSNLGTNCYSFGALATDLKVKRERSISYLSKYSYNGTSISAGVDIDTDSMWLGTIRDNDTRFSKVAIWSLLLYPYSMSEFLIERQLRKLKVGTLYPGMVQWKPLFESNLEYDAAVLTYNAEGVSQGAAILGKYYSIGTKISIGIKPKDTLAEVSKLTCNGEELKLSNITNQGYYIYYTTIDKVPQRIDITIDEYIRYEDILQVYPTVVHFTNEDGTYEYTWGDKIKVGSKIKYKKYENLLPDFYTIKGALYFNGQRFGEANKYGIVTKTSTFSWSDKFLWKLSTPEALFMYDPAMINNAGLNNLGYLPDITGQGRHLKLNNFTYEGISGKDGYPVVFGEKKTWTSIRSNGNTFVAEFESCLINVKKVDFGGALTYTYIKSNGILTDYNKDIPSFRVKIQGLNGDFGVKYTYIDSESSTTKREFEITKDGTYTLPKSYAATDNLLNENVWIGFNCFDLRSVGHYDCNVSISVVPEYTGALCFDGINNRCIVENITYGGKYLGMKTNWKSKGAVIYDQRKTVNYTGLCVYLPGTTEESQFPAYQTRNQDGYTYIDSVLNKYITTAELYAKTHVFETVCETDDSSNTVSPVFGSTVGGSNFSQFAMYRTVVLPEVPSNSDREILCGWLGTSEGYVEKPEYYWDAYGKTNDEGDSRVNILEQVRKQSGVSQDNMFLRNQNIAYDETSGYGGGYLFNFNTIPVTVTKVSNTDDTLVISRDSTTDQSWVVNLGKQNKKFELYVDWEGTETPRKLIWSKTTEGVATTINTMILNKGWNTVPVVEDDYTSIYLTQQSIGQTTIRQKRIYHDGLVLDGIDDYIECTNIPAFTDYTYIIKFEDLGNSNKSSCVQHKGSVKNAGGAFVQNYIDSQNQPLQYNFGSTNMLSSMDNIQYCTKTNYNGNALTVGTNTDDPGLIIGKWTVPYKMVFYKEMLWSKTIDPLSIGMIRNLMEQDGIIDLKNKLFKKDVVVSSVNNETSISNNTLIKNE